MSNTGLTEDDGEKVESAEFMETQGLKDYGAD